MELGHWVAGSSFWLGVRPEFFRFTKKCPKMQNVHLKCWNNKSPCQVFVVGLKSLDVSPCHELLLLPVIIKHSLAPLHESRHLEFITEQGLWLNRVTGSLDSRVTGSQNVSQFHVCGQRRLTHDPHKPSIHGDPSDPRPIVSCDLHDQHELLCRAKGLTGHRSTSYEAES